MTTRRPELTSYVRLEAGGWLIAVVVSMSAMSGVASASLAERPDPQRGSRPTSSGGAAPASPIAAAALETRTGRATYIAQRLNGRKTASGEIYDGTKLVAAHPSYPLGTRVRVTNPENERTVDVQVIDRSAAGKGRPIIDLSRAAAERLDIIQRGIATVRVDVLQWGPSRPRPPFSQWRRRRIRPHCQLINGKEHLRCMGGGDIAATEKGSRHVT